MIINFLRTFANCLTGERYKGPSELSSSRYSVEIERLSQTGPQLVSTAQFESLAEAKREFDKYKDFNMPDATHRVLIIRDRGSIMDIKLTRF